MTDHGKGEALAANVAALDGERPGTRGVPDWAEFRARRRFGSLDGFRCLSILGVVWHHCHGGLELGRIGTRGDLGVAMFFVLSGFLIVTLLLRERARADRISLRSFYARRSLRIMPLYYGVILGSVVVFLGFLPESSTAEQLRDGLPYLVTYTTNWVIVGTFLAISWSLSAEEQFYLVWPAVEKFARHAVWVLLALTLLSMLLDLGLLHGPLREIGLRPNAYPMLRLIGFTPILLGVLLAHVLHERRGFEAFSRLFGGRFAALVLAAALVAYLELVSTRGGTLVADPRGWPKVVVYVLMMLLLGSAVVREDHALAPLLRWRPIERIGVVSYGMYLLHLPVAALVSGLLASHGVSGLPLFLAIVIGTILAAELSYRFYEMPFLNLKKRFAR